MQLENWKESSSLKPEKIDKILTEYFNLYPPTWTLRIKGIIFEAQDQKSKVVKDQKSREWVAGSAEFDPSDNLWKIHIYPKTLKMSLDQNPSFLCETFSHEMAHTNDWGSIGMIPEQKLIFFKRSLKDLMLRTTMHIWTIILTTSA